jgi:hypothetical protein
LLKALIACVSKPHRYILISTTTLTYFYCISVRGVHSSGETSEGDTKEAGGEEAGRDQEDPSRAYLLQVLVVTLGNPDPY